MDLEKLGKPTREKRRQASPQRRLPTPAAGPVKHRNSTKDTAHSDLVMDRSGTQQKTPEKQRLPEKKDEMDLLPLHLVPDKSPDSSPKDCKVQQQQQKYKVSTFLQIPATATDRQRPPPGETDNDKTPKLVASTLFKRVRTAECFADCMDIPSENHKPVELPFSPASVHYRVKRMESTVGVVHSNKHAPVRSSLYNKCYEQQ